MAAELDPILRAIDLIAPAFAESDLDEVEIETDGLSVRLARPRAVPAYPAPAEPSTSAGSPASGAPSGAPEPAGVTPFGSPMPGMRFVSAPLTGVWYSAPSPESRAYVQVGSQVAVGQVIGLIEAMKLFNEIKADVSGTVTRVLVENGTLVKRQQPVLEIDPR